MIHLLDQVCIDSRIVGTKRHLLQEIDGGFSWVDEVPNNAFHFNGKIKSENDNCFDTLLALGHKKIDINPPEKYVTMMSQVNYSTGSYIPWQKVMSRDEHKTFLNRLTTNINSLYKELPKKYYDKTWVHGNAVFRSLQPAKVNQEKIQHLLSNNVGNSFVIKTFLPQDGDFATTPLYNRFGTRTGRPTIKDGPNILTLKREYRDLIVPSTKSGKIIMVDFSALEARIALYEVGKICKEHDLYDEFAKEFGFDRTATKGAIICELYGRSPKALAATLKLDLGEAYKFLSSVRNKFETHKLLDRIKIKYFECGYVVNRYGRLITIDEPVDHVFINYYCQSTGADLTLLGFEKLISNFQDISDAIRPLFILHDALILDVPREFIDDVMNTRYVSVPGYVQKFAIKPSFIGA